MYKLRIRDYDVGARCAFPLLYFYTQKEFPDFRRVFETFIGFAVRNSPGIDWRELRVHTVDGVPTPRDDQGHALLTDLIPDLFDPQTKWQAAVPILTLRRSATAEPVPGIAVDAPAPAYLSSRGNWVVSPTPGHPPAAKPAYPESAYLVTKDRVFTPICMACPRILHHDAGHCFVGDAVCFSHLQRFSADNQFARKIRVYEDVHDVRKDTAGDAVSSAAPEEPPCGGG